MALGARIKQRRKELGLTQEQLARLVGVYQSTIQSLESRDSKKSDYTDAIARALDISVEWLRTGQSDAARAAIAEPAIDAYCPPSLENVYAAPEIKGVVPLISWVKAGDWSEAADHFEPGDAEDWLPCPKTHGPRTFALRVRGDSMTSPFPGQRSYPEGTIIYIDPDVPADQGRRVVAKLIDTNEVTFKTLRNDAGKNYLAPINPQYPNLEINGNCVIVGVVIGSFLPE